MRLLARLFFLCLSCPCGRACRRQKHAIAFSEFVLSFDNILSLDYGPNERIKESLDAYHEKGAIRSDKKAKDVALTEIIFCRNLEELHTLVKAPFLTIFRFIFVQTIATCLCIFVPPSGVPAEFGTES